MVLPNFLSVLLTEGGPVAYLILAVFAGGAALAVERAIAVLAATRARPQRLAADVLALIERHDVTGACELCRNGRSIASATLAGVLSEVLAPSGPIVEERLRERADHALSLRAMPAARRLDLLSTIANTATLLGLFGTVVGLRDALAPGAGGAAGGAAALNAGIARALQATALGIVAAIPLLLAQSYLRARVEDAVGEARATAEGLIVLLVKRARAEEAARAVLAREKGRYARAADADAARRQAAEDAEEKRQSVVVR